MSTQVNISAPAYSARSLALHEGSRAESPIGEERLSSNSAPDEALKRLASRLDYLGARLDEITAAAKINIAEMDGGAIQALLEKLEVAEMNWRLVSGDLAKRNHQGLTDSPKGKKLADDYVEPPGSPRGGVKAKDDFFEQLMEMIGFIKDDYLSVYENMLTKYSDFYKEFNETVMSKMGGWIELNSGNGSYIFIEVGAIRRALEALLVKYSTPPTGTIFPVSGTGASYEEAMKWAEAMGLPPSCVVADLNGGFAVVMDLKPISAMLSSLPAWGLDPGTRHNWDPAKFQAWQTGFNSMEGDLKNQLQLFTTKYSNANSYHENFNKILSSQMSQFADMLKQMASGIA